MAGVECAMFNLSIISQLRTFAMLMSRATSAFHAEVDVRISSASTLPA
jgi:hypothetical protein